MRRREFISLLGGGAFAALAARGAGAAIIGAPVGRASVSAVGDDGGIRQEAFA
jgi:hypothetical protein